MGTKGGKGLLAALVLMSVFLFTPIPSNAGVIPVQVLNMTGNTQGELITVNIGSFINVTTVAGFYNAILTVPDAPIWTGDYTSFGFCAEAAAIYEYNNYGGYSLYELTPPYTNAAWLMQNYRISPNYSYNTASLQVAIWEALLDPTFDLTSGNFVLLSGLDPDEANEMLAALSSADLSSFNTAGYRIASDDGLGTTAGIQDLIIYNAAAVPIPSGLLLLGSGLFAFIGLRKKLVRR